MHTERQHSCDIDMLWALAFCFTAQKAIKWLRVYVKMAYVEWTGIEKDMNLKSKSFRAPKHQ